MAELGPAFATAHLERNDITNMTGAKHNKFLAIRRLRVIEALHKAKDRKGVYILSWRGSAQTMNWSCKAIWYTDEGYEIYFASERNWISYGPDGWVRLANSLDDAKQMCDSQEKVRTDILGRS